MFADDVFEDVPNDGFLLLDHFLGLLDGGAMALSFELVIDEGLEELKRHLFGQPALVELQLRADDDDGAAGIVHALAEEVLSETPLLALERVAEGLERAVVGSAQNAAAAAVVEQRVDSFLEHALFVAHDDVRRAKFHELLQTVIAVDYAAVKVVQIGGGETAAVQRHQRAQLRRKNRNHVENHPLRLVAALAEGFEHFEALGEFDPLLQRRIGLHLFAQLFGQLVHLDAAEKLLDGFRAHFGGELARVFLLHLAILVFEQHFPLAENGDFAGIHDDKSFKIEDALEIAHGNVQQITDAAGQALEKPHVRAGRSQLDVAEALAADFAQGDFDAALIADNAAVLHPLVLAAQAFPVGDGAKNLGAKEAIALGLGRAVVDGLRLGHFAVGPGTNFFGARQADANGIEIGDQTGAIIRAAAIQGCFLPPAALRPRAAVRWFGPAENPLQNFKNQDCLPVGAQHAAPLLGEMFPLIGRFLRRRLLPLHQFDVETERLQFANEYVERFRHARLNSRLALDDGLVNLRAT